MGVLQWLLESTVSIGGSTVLVRELLGNLFGLLSALGGMRRKVWAWPVGIVGNVLLFTVFLGSVFNTSSAEHQTAMLGQAGRQVMFVAVAIWGWWRWAQTRKSAGSGDRAVVPVWAGWPARIGLVLGMLVGTVALTPIFRALGSYEPVWADAWIFTGSLLATYGMARGWVEFWLIWVAVDLVGVPLLLSAGYYATAGMYVFYGVFTLIGFFVWLRARERRQIVTVETAYPDVAARSEAGVPDDAGDVALNYPGAHASDRDAVRGPARPSDERRDGEV